MRIPLSLFLVLATMMACGGGSGPSSVPGDCPFLGGTTPFRFSPAVGVSLNSPVVSNSVTIRCGSDLGIRIVGGSYSIDGAAFTSVTGTIGDGQRLRIQVVSAGTFATAKAAGVEVGFLGTFNVMTAEFKVTTAEGDPDNAPTATIEWPLDNSIHNASRILVSGRASDPDGISEILVNGVPATSGDRYQTWSADVALVTGLNAITVSTADSLLNTNPVAASISINNLAVVASRPIDIAVDENRSRLLVLDSELPALIEIDFEDGAHRLISDNSTPNSYPQFLEPSRMVLDDGGDRVWIIDNGYDDLVSVDLDTGIRELTEDETLPQPGAEIWDAHDLAIDAIENQALVLVGTLNSALNDTRLVALDLATGARVVLSDATIPTAENPLGPLFYGVTIQFDRVGYRLLAFQEDSLLAIDPLTGDRRVFSPDGIESPVDTSLDADNNRVLVLNRSGATVNGVDLNSGGVERLWYVPEYNPRRIALDARNNRILVLLHPPNREIFSIDMDTGDMSIAY